MSLVAIITHSRTIYRTTKLTTELEKLEIPHRVVIPKRSAISFNDGVATIHQGKQRFWPLLALNALYHNSGEGLAYIEALEAVGVPVLNSSEAWRRAKSKPLTTACLAAAGIPHPDTIYAYRGRTLARFLPRKGSTFVSKPWSGSLGKGVTRASLKTYRRRLRLKRRRSRPAYLQKFVPNPGRDIRVVVVDGRTVGAAYRIAPEGEWKTNVTTGGQPVYCRVDRELSWLAVRATRALKLDVAGVDIIEGPQGYTVVELNGWPDYEEFDAVAETNVAREVARAIDDRWSVLS